MKRLIAIVFAVCVLAIPVRAQLDLNALKNQSESRARDRKTESQQFLSSRNSKWADFLNSRGAEWEKVIANRDVEWTGFLSDSAWTVFDDFLINEPPRKKPKPVIPPDVQTDPAPIPVKTEPIVVEPVKTEPVKTEPVETVPRPLLPDIMIDISSAKPIPPCKPIIQTPVKTRNQIDYYGRTVEIEYDPAMARITEKGFTQKTISDFWKKASDANYTVTVANLLDVKDEVSLNDWSYYLLIKDFSSKLYTDENMATLLTWFLLVRSGLDARVGISDRDVALMIPSETTIYGISYLEMGDKTYYLVRKGDGGIKTYNNDYAAASQFDLNQLQPPVLGGSKAQRHLAFKFGSQEYEFDLNYDQDLIKYYSDVPLAQYEIYFDAAPSSLLSESVLENLKPAIAGMDVQTTANFLLRFVQLAFPYKTDDDQFGYEKYFYTEEVLLYPYCDCEDRSVIYSYLVRNLLGKKVVGVEYPGHMATAVESTGIDVDGTRYSYKGETYIIADPTYIRSSIGMCMPSYKDVTPTIHEIR